MGYSFVYNSGSYEEEKPSEKLHLEFGLFFDGTLNNKEHTALRLKVLNIDDLIIYPSDSEKTVRSKEQELAKRRERIHQGGLSEKDKDAFRIKIKKDYYKKKGVVPTEKEVEQILQDIIKKDVKDYQRADERDWLDKQGVDNSFMNDYTNVARLYMSCNREYAIYIEGIGTLYKEKDVDAGFQYGSGTSGIRAKVRKGCKELAQKIIEAKNKREKIRKITSLSVTVDVFGFSRGATAARNFIYEINCTNKREKDTLIEQKTEKIGEEFIQYTDLYGNIQYTTFNKYTFSYYDKDKELLDENLLIEGKMPKLGYLGYYLLEKGISKKELDIINLKIRFIGIYDTVSSYKDVGDLNWYKTAFHGVMHSLANYFEDDVEELQINNLGNFERAIHFVAMDEHRKNFALTRLQGRNCIEKVFPGVHSDVGGGYETGIEVVDELEIAPAKIFFKPFLYARKHQLISKYWYTDKQLKIELEQFPFSSESEERNRYIAYFKKIKDYCTNLQVDIQSLFQYNKLRGVRYLKKEYSYIPLHLMEKEFRKVLSQNQQKKILKKPTEIDYPLIIYKDGEKQENKELVTAKKILDTYVSFEKATEWKFIADKELDEMLQNNWVKHLLSNFQYTKEEITKGKKQEQEQDFRIIKKDHTEVKKAPLYTQENLQKEEFKKSDPLFIAQKTLRILRNQYLHWSANKDWLGMNPTFSGIRKEY